MSRGLTTEVETALDQPVIARRLLVELEFDSGTARYWDGRGDLSALGEIWTGVGRLGSVDAIDEEVGLSAKGAKLNLTIIPTDDIPDAPDQVLNIALAEEYQGRPVTIYVALMNLATRTVIADPFPRFRGYLDVLTEIEIPGAARIEVTAENRLIDLERPALRTYTPEDQKAVYSDDTFFDYVHLIRSREIVLK